MSPEYLQSVLSIIIIDLVLSGDNAVVIGMAAHRLPPRQQRIAILFGGGAAIGLRIALTAVATFLLLVPGLQAIGGVLLLWIAFKLLKEEEESAEGVKVAASMREAIATILVADFIMSLDNVLGVAAAAHGDLALLMFGLILSMTILMLGGSLVANLINRMWWLAYVGSAVIAYTGVEMLFKDRFVADLRLLPEALHLPIAVVVTVVTLGAAHYFHRHRPAVAARLRAAEAGVEPATPPSPAE